MTPGPDDAAQQAQSDKWLLIALCLLLAASVAGDHRALRAVAGPKGDLPRPGVPDGSDRPVRAMLSLELPVLDRSPPPPTADAWIAVPVRAIDDRFDIQLRLGDRRWRVLSGHDPAASLDHAAEIDGFGSVKVIGRRQNAPDARRRRLDNGLHASIAARDRYRIELHVDIDAETAAVLASEGADIEMTVTTTRSTAFSDAAAKLALALDAASADAAKVCDTAAGSVRIEVAPERVAHEFGVFDLTTPDGASLLLVEDPLGRLSSDLARCDAARLAIVPDVRAVRFPGVEGKPAAEIPWVFGSDNGSAVAHRVRTEGCLIVPSPSPPQFLGAWDRGTALRHFPDLVASGTARVVHTLPAPVERADKPYALRITVDPGRPCELLFPTTGNMCVHFVQSLAPAHSNATVAWTHDDHAHWLNQRFLSNLTIEDRGAHRAAWVPTGIDAEASEKRELLVFFHDTPPPGPIAMVEHEDTIPIYSLPVASAAPQQVQFSIRGSLRTQPANPGTSTTDRDVQLRWLPVPAN